MSSSEKNQSSVIQKEWYFVRNGEAHSFLFAKDYPFEIDSKFRSKITGEDSKIGQIVNIHPVEDSIAWEIITREFGKRSLRLLDHEKMNLVSIIVDAILKAISYIVSAIVFIGKPILESQETKRHESV